MKGGSQEVKKAGRKRTNQACMEAGKQPGRQLGRQEGRCVHACMRARENDAVVNGLFPRQELLQASIHQPLL